MYLRSLQTKISNLKESILDSEDVLMPKLLTYMLQCFIEKIQHKNTQYPLEYDDITDWKKLREKNKHKITHTIY